MRFPNLPHLEGSSLLDLQGVVHARPQNHLNLYRRDTADQAIRLVSIPDAALSESLGRLWRIFSRREFLRFGAMRNKSTVHSETNWGQNRPPAHRSTGEVARLPPPR